MPASARRDVNDWLDLLVYVEEPFIAPPVADRVFPEGPTRTDKTYRDAARDRVEATVNPDGTLKDDADPPGFARWMLTDVLGHHPSGPSQTIDLDPDLAVDFVAQAHDVVLTPTCVVHDPGEPAAVRMLVFAEPGMVLPDDPNDYEPAERFKQQGWTASAVHRATRAARSFGARLALITNGRLWTLVGIAEQTVGHGTWDALLFWPEPRLLDSFVQTLRATRMFGPEDETPEALLDESIGAQQNVAKHLGSSIRRAAELLVAAFSDANRRHGGRLLEHVDDDEVYQATVTVLMRLVFLLYAEENGLLRVDNQLYRAHYAASSLLDDLFDRARRGRGQMQYHTDAWHRLLAVSRAVHGGVNTDKLIVAEYGGSLFDPDRFPFLEGRVVDANGNETDTIRPDLVDDLTVLEIMRAITVVKGRRVSFRALEVEQIGHVYEALLDHSTVRAQGPVLGLTGKDGLEPEMRLDLLEERHAEGVKKFATWYAKQDGVTLTYAKTRDALNEPPREEIERGLLAACGGDQDLYERVGPFANLLRTDLRGLPMVMLEGDLYVTETGVKSDTGTAYTTPELAREIVQHALDPLLYSPGPQDTRNEDNWVPNSSEEILKLKVCDPAIGSAAIAVAAVRYLAEHLVDARHREGTISDEQLVSAEADQTTLDVHVQARRDIVAHCIYGVDVDPMAVEMAKMSLWLVTLSKDRPFTFLDHAIKCGNSLLGITDLAQLRQVHLAPDNDAATQTALAVERGFEDADAASNYFAAIDRAIAEATVLRTQLRDSDVTDATDAASKAKLHNQVENITHKLKAVADAVTAACLSTAGGTQSERDARLQRVPPLLGDLTSKNSISRLVALATKWRDEHKPDTARPRRFFHWPLEFPEVFDRNGRFDVIVGNPPFLGGSKISAPHGKDFREHLVEYVAQGDRGVADLVAFFLRRSTQVADRFGLLATNTVAQGDTRKVGLRAICDPRVGRLHEAVASTQWPGASSVYISKLWWTTQPWHSAVKLDGNPVGHIESDLYPAGDVPGEPFRLSEQKGTAGIGQVVYGQGFIVTPDQARSMIDADPRNSEVLAPYISGADINSSPTHESDRWIINFHQWPLERAQTYELPYRVVLQEVKPERETKSDRLAREKWWQFLRYRPEIVEQVENLDRIIVMAQVSSRVVPVMVEPGPVFSHKVIVFPYDDFNVYSALTSTVHRVWVDRYTSTMKADISYSPTDAFETFPLPPPTDDLEGMMRALHTWRSDRMIERDQGITTLYGHYHDPDYSDPIVEELRERHRDLDDAVLDAYGWSDVDLGHGFYDTRYGVFYTVSAAARFELLDRLLRLNFEQYAEQTGRSLDGVIEEAQQHV